MERRIQDELKRYYEAPEPKKKQAFIRQLGVQRINYRHLIAMQARYLSKWVWMVSFLFCGLTFGIVNLMEEKYICMIYGLVPFLVMVTVTESMRSYRYGMEELELSARFSLKSIVMARMLMLGIGNMVVLAIAIFLLGSRMEHYFFQVLTPYFLTAGGSLYLVRRIPGKENTFFCFTLAAGVSVLQVLLPWQWQEIFQPGYTPVWAAVCLIGIFITIRESYRTIRMTEDLAWN